MKISASVPEQFKVGEKNFWIAFIAFVVLLFLILVVFPWWHERYFGVAANESAAVGALRWVNALENQYAAAHADKGFACEFLLLQATEQMSGAAARNPRKLYPVNPTATTSLLSAAPRTRTESSPT